MRTYYKLCKPGIVYGNAMTALAAFVFASAGQVDALLLLAMLVGLSFSIASGCVINNVLDRDIDAHMERTKDRATTTGQVSVRNALLFAIPLGICGIAILYFFTTLLALYATLFGVVVYLGLYTPLKRVSQHSTIVGALAGAVPPVVGYGAVTNTLDGTAMLLFLILVCWQMTHFFAIAIFRKEEYQKAGLPVMPVRVGIFRTKVLMVLYAVLFSAAVLALSFVNSLTVVYTLPMAVLSAGWIGFSVSGFYTKNDRRWARSVFFYSLILLVAFSVLLALS
jgi:protoheme IX farnesyltransferase